MTKGSSSENPRTIGPSSSSVKPKIRDKENYILGNPIFTKIKNDQLTHSGINSAWECSLASPRVVMTVGELCESIR